MIARTSNNLTQWLKFFLVGIIETSKSSIGVFKKILRLKSNLETEVIPKLGSKVTMGQMLLKILYQVPVINIKKISILMDVSTSTANRLMIDFVNLGILQEFTGYKRNRKFIFRAYVDLFK